MRTIGLRVDKPVKVQPQKEASAPVKKETEKKK